MYLNTAADLHIHEVVQQVARVVANPALGGLHLDLVNVDHDDAVLGILAKKNNVPYPEIVDIVIVGVCHDTIDRRGQSTLHAKPL